MTKLAWTLQLSRSTSNEEGFPLDHIACTQSIAMKAYETSGERAHFTCPLLFESDCFALEGSSFCDACLAPTSIQVQLQMALVLADK